MKHRNILIQSLFLTILSAMAAFATPPSESPYSIPQPPFFGQIRTRTELDQKALADTTVNRALMSTQLRSRLGFVATPSEKVAIKVEFQDVRFLGSEPNAGATPTDSKPGVAPTATVGNLKGLDLLQGYVAVQEGPVKAVLGRQKMQLGAGRFISTLEWSPTSRAFDGFSTNWTQGQGDLTGIAFLIKDTLNAAVDTGTATGNVRATGINDRELLTGLHYDYKFNDNLTAQAYSFYDQSRLKNIYSKDTLNGYDLGYFGERVVGKFAFFAFEEEFIWQGGVSARGPKDSIHMTSAAFQGALRLGVAFPKIKANVGADVMSGDSNGTDNETHLYRANYYFAHALYGWMDYFASNPKFGVIDYRVDADAILWEGEANKSISLKAQYHYFLPQQPNAANDNPYGQEINAELHMGLYPKSNIVLGASAFFADKSAYLLPAARLKSGQGDETGYFFYLMPTFNF